MKNVRRITLAFALTIAIFATPIFADGDMGGGGFVDDGSATCSMVESSDNFDGDMGGGGFTGDMGGGGYCADEEPSLIDSLLEGVSTFFNLNG